MGHAQKHLSPGRLEEIARCLFEVKSEDEQAGELHGLCPIHGEKNPSFSYNWKKDQYSCFSCQASGDLIKLWGATRGMDSKAAFLPFCEAYNIPTGYDRSNGAANHRKSAARPDAPAPPSKSAPPRTPSLDAIWKMFPPLDNMWLKKVEQMCGWSAEACERLDLRMQTHYQDKDGGLVELKKPMRVAIPIRDTKGKLCNIRIYQPGAKQRKIISWGKGYGSARLFPRSPSDSAGPVLLCEGEKDTICAISRGFNAITQTSKTKRWKQEHTEPFKDRDVVIAYDADQPGQNYAGFAAECLQNIASSVRMLTWPDYMGRRKDGTWPEKSGQDLADFFLAHKKSPSALQSLIDAAKPYIRPDGPPETEAEQASVTQFFDFTISGRHAFKPRLLAKKVIEDMQLMNEPGTGILYTWNGEYWQPIPEDAVYQRCLLYLGDESQRQRATDAAWQARMLSTLPIDRAINDREDWVCIKNGMLNLQNLELRKFSKDFYATYQLPVKFDPVNTVKPERWLKYADQTIQIDSAIAQAQEFAGYCMTRSTQYEKCLLLFGPGSDGKSIFLKTLTKLVGPENCSAVAFSELENQFQRASLYCKQLNTSTEIGSQALESPYFKAIVSGDAINASFKHRDTFEFRPYCKLAFACNKLPRVLDNSDGYFRRLLLVEFRRQYLEDDPDRDPYLENKLEAELSDIFAWAIVGLHRLKKQGRFTNSDEAASLMMRYRRLNDPVACFLEDECILDASQRSAKSTMRERYKKYCYDNGYQPLSQENFFHALYVAHNTLRTYRPRVGSKRVQMLEGIGLKPDVIE